MKLHPVQPPERSRTAAMSDDGFRELRAIVTALASEKFLFLAYVVVLGSIAAVFAYTIPGRYESGASVLVQPVGDLAAPSTASAQTPPEIVRSQLEVVRSPAVLGRVVDALGLMNDPEFASARSLRKLDPEMRRAAVLAAVDKHLKVDNDGRSVTIHIGFEARSPKKAQRIADAIANDYIRTANDLKNRAVSLTKTRLEQRLSDLRLDTVQAEDAAEDYRRAKGLVWLAPATDGDTRTSGATYTSRLLDQFSRQAAEITAQAEQAEAKAQVAGGDMVRSGGANTPEVLSSAVVAAFLQQDAVLATTEASLAARYTPEYPPLVQVRAQRANLRNALGATRDSIKRSLDMQARSAGAANRAAGMRAQALEGVVSRQTADTVRYRQLQSEAATKRKIYEDFAGRAGTISERSLLQLPDAVLIAPASLPIRESWPNRPIFLAMGCLAAIVIGAAVALAVSLRKERARR